MPTSFAGLEYRADLRLLLLCLILGITSWTGLCRLLRGEVLKLRVIEFVRASEALGASQFSILARHILPNVTHIVLISVALDFSSLVLAEAILSYVNIGVDPTMASWGNMINSARLELARTPVVWWSLASAFIFMLGLVLPANFFADALSNAWDPRLVSPIKTMMNDTDTLLNVSELCVGKAGSGDLVHNVSFTIQRGQVLSLLGETGSGKTLTALSIIRLLSPGLSLTGSIEMAGQNLLKLSEKEMRLWRGRRIAMIFQEPQTALNPVLSVGRQLDEVLKLTPGLSAAGRWDRALELLEAVRLPEPHRHILEYPHQLSGGMKQRVMIALALAGDPDLLIADEPTTALDVTVQSQILDVLLDLQKKRNMALLLITHDLGVAARMADSIVVMKEGSMVETAAAPAFFKAPQHEYSRELFGNLPERMDPRPPPPDNNGQPILEVRNLSVHFPIKRGILRRTPRLCTSRERCDL